MKRFNGESAKATSAENTSEQTAPERKGLSRRSFLSGAVLAAASAGAMGLMSGCAPKTSSGTSNSTASGSGTAITVNENLAVSPAGTNYPWAAEPPEIADSQVESEVDCDVVVVGLGVSGVSAFRAAAEAGAKVVGFEKGAEVGVRSSQYAYLNGTMTDRFNLGTFDLDKVIQEEFEECSSMTKYPIVRKWAYNSAAAYDWWCAGDADLYIPVKGEVVDEKTHPVYVSSMSDPSIDYENERQAAYPENLSFSDHKHVVNANLQKGIDKGGTANFGHFVEKLITDDSGKVTGVYARNASTGKYVKANAKKGVILSCGDCRSNRDMVAYFIPSIITNGNGNPWPNTDVEGNKTNTGDGYKLGYWAGAAIQDLQTPMTHIMGGPADSDSQAESMGIMSNAPFMRLNYKGQRFMNEDTCAADAEYPVELQPKHKCFMIWDSHYAEQVPTFVNMFPVSSDSLEKAVDNKTVFKANTLKELLSSIDGMDVTTGLASIDHYNEMCTAGYDSDFCKKAKYLNPVKDGPFYAQRMGVGLCLVLMGGLESDENAHVIDVNGDVIPGLYVSGNCQGNRFAVKYPFRLSGTSHSMAMYYGKVAGENAVAGI